jgi:hypothetical protein
MALVIAAYNIEDGNGRGWYTERNTLTWVLADAERFPDRATAEHCIATRIDKWDGWSHILWVPETLSTVSRPVDTTPAAVSVSPSPSRAGRAVKGRKAQPTAPSRQAEPSMPKATTDKVRTIKGKPVMRTTARKVK